MKLYYVHDPMCSWCWAFRPIYLSLLEHLPQEIEFIKLLGGLAPDTDKPMPSETRNYVISQWQKIQHEVPDTQFNYDFWRLCKPRRCTYPACRAVIAARQQNLQFDDSMTLAIQQAYYLHAKNPSDLDTLIELAEEIGCDSQQFANDIDNANIEKQLQHELSTARALGLNSFPGFLLTDGKNYKHIQPDYHNADRILFDISKGLE